MRDLAVYFIVTLAVVGAITYLNWGLVHAAPRAVALWLPPRFFQVLGLSLLLLGIFTGLFSAYAFHDMSGVIKAFVQIFAGLWFLLAPTVGQRGSYEDEQMLRRIFLMLGLLEATVLMIAVLDEPRALAALSLSLITGGFWVTTNFITFLDRGR